MSKRTAKGDEEPDYRKTRKSNARGYKEIRDGQFRDRDRRNRELVKAMGLVDEGGNLAQPGLQKSRAQIVSEARLELQQQILDLHVAGMSVADVATYLDLEERHVRQMVDQALANVATTQAQATPLDHFGRYAYFHMRQIQRLDRLIEQFMADPEAKQYNATVTAERARSDLLDKVYRMGSKLGVLKLAKADREAGKSGADLVKALIEERAKLDSVIGELECSIEAQVIRAKVKRSRDRGVTSGVTTGEDRTLQRVTSCYTAEGDSKGEDLG